MPWLECDVSGVALPQCFKKRFNVRRDERKARRQLDQQARKTFAERCGVGEKGVERVIRSHQPFHMGDELRHLDRKSEMVRHARRPPEIGGSPMPPMERRMISV